MDILRRNTDYALRLMVGLAQRANAGAVSTRVLAQGQEVSYQLACKLMQHLQDAGIVQSTMGPKGGFQLGRQPDQISLLEVIEAVQGPLRLNRCLLREAGCPRQDICPIRAKIGTLQDQMGEYLGGITLADLAANRNTGRPVRTGEPAGEKA
jgi:Rrf2 family protein